MRGVENTTTTRIYRSDAVRCTDWLGVLNARIRSRTKLTTADLHRHIHRENKRLRDRNQFLLLETARLERELKVVQEKCRRLESSYLK